MNVVTTEKIRYPIFLDLTGRLAVIVGAGEVGASKAAALIDTGAEIRVIGPAAVAEISSLAGSGRLTWVKRDFAPEDLEGAFLVIAATDDPEANRRAGAEAGRRGALVNVVDQPGLCDFFVPAVVRRGRLQVAVSTGGAGPGLGPPPRRRAGGGPG